jgi:hypothetical protein
VDNEPTGNYQETGSDVQKMKKKLFRNTVEFLYDFDKMSQELADLIGEDSSSGSDLVRNWEIQTSDVPIPQYLEELDVDSVKFFYMPQRDIAGRPYPETIGVKINDESEEKRHYYLLQITNPGKDEEVNFKRIVENTDTTPLGQVANHQDFLYLKQVLSALRDSHQWPLATP